MSEHDIDIDDMNDPKLLSACPKLFEEGVFWAKTQCGYRRSLRIEGMNDGSLARLEPKVK